MQHSLKAVVEASLARQSPSPFAPALEVLYETDGGAYRRRRLSLALVVVAAAILAALALDTPRTPAVLIHCFAWRTAAALAVLGAAFAAKWANTAPREAAVVTFAALVAMSVVEVLGERAGPDAAGVYMVAALALVAGLIASGHVRLTTALVASASCGVVFPLVILLRPGAPAVFAGAGAPTVVVITFSALCLAARRNEINRRVEFLHRLRHEVVEAEMLALNAELLKLSSTDMLTGLANRRFFEAEARRVWEDGDQPPFALAIVDVDRFKAFNDAAGHSAGDRCLVAVAEALRGAVRRDADRAARYGGEEFAILVPGFEDIEPGELGERLRRAVEAMHIPHPAFPGQTVTVSVGVAWQQGRAGSLDAVLGEADRLLYRAKETGRNRACCAARA